MSSAEPSLTLDPSGLPSRWKDNPEIFPDFAAMAEAMQDPGKVKSGAKSKAEKKTGVQRRQFELDGKLATVTFKNILQLHKPQGITVNVSRGKEPLAIEIVTSRRHVDTCDTQMAFHAYGKERKVCIVKNCVKCAGVDLAVERFQEAHERAMREKAAHRTPNDGMRLCGILLEQKHRDTVGGIVTNKKDRKKSDVAGDPNLSFFESILPDFRDVLHDVKHPLEECMADFDDEDKSKWDPNDQSIFEHDRDKHWLMDMLVNHVRPKCKKALDKWNKDAGGGDCKVTSFVDFMLNDCWLAWMFCLDCEQGFLLANDAGGGMPRHLNVEGGFDDPVEVDDQSPMEKKLEAELSASKEQRKELAQLTTLVGNLIQLKMEKPGVASTECRRTPVNPSIECCFKRAGSYEKHLKQLETKTDMPDAMKNQMRRVLKKRHLDFYNRGIEIGNKLHSSNSDEDDDFMWLTEVAQQTNTADLQQQSEENGV